MASPHHHHSSIPKTLGSPWHVLPALQALRAWWLLACVPAGTGTCPRTLAVPRVPQHCCCFLHLLQLAKDLHPLHLQLPAKSSSSCKVCSEVTCSQGTGNVAKASPASHQLSVLPQHPCTYCLYCLYPCTNYTWPCPAPCSPGVHWDLQALCDLLELVVLLQEAPGVAVHPALNHTFLDHYFGGFRHPAVGLTCHLPTTSIRLGG